MNERIDVEALAHLAQIALTEEEKCAFASDLEAMVAFGRALNAADLSTTTSAQDAQNTECLSSPLRADEPSSCLDREAIMNMAASAADGYVTVVRVLSHDENASEKEGEKT